MTRDYNELVYEWLRDANLDFDADKIAEKIEYLTQRLFQQYTPTIGPHPDFRQRLNGWLHSAPDDECRKVLFQLVPHLFFIGREEFIALYHAAFRGPILRWIIDQLGISLDDPNVQQKTEQALSKTWFCPITDSMQIAEFYHANKISGANYRPTWHSLPKLGNSNQVLDFIKKRGFERIVLLEDFVGSGGQIRPALEFATSLSPTLPFPICPLVACPEGIRRGIEFIATHRNFSFEVVLPLSAGALIGEVCIDGENSFFDSVRAVVNSLHDIVSGATPADRTTRPYGPFGFKKTGALVVMYTNTPDNTLPVIHFSSHTWPSPIFPRSSRI